MSDGNGYPERRSVVEVIRGIKAGTVDAKQLDAVERQGCVAHLRGEGYLTPEIAEILKVSERTVTRDRASLREEASVSRDPALAGRMAGQLVGEAELCIGRIRRAVRDRGTPAATKVEAERACFQVLDRAIQRLQSMGYLPTAPQHVSAELTHRVEAVPDPRALQHQVEQFREVVETYGGPDEELKTRLLRLDAASRLLLEADQLEGPGNEDSDGSDGVS